VASARKISQGVFCSMGGSGSGRPTVEDGLTLDLAKLCRNGCFRSGYSWGSALFWRETYTRRHVASIGYQGFMDEKHGRVGLTYTTARWDGPKHRADSYRGPPMPAVAALTLLVYSASP